jgi:hypothetical protein
LQRQPRQQQRLQLLQPHLQRPQMQLPLLLVRLPRQQQNSSILMGLNPNIAYGHHPDYGSDNEPQ